MGCCRSTEMVDSSPSTDSWATVPWTESVDFSLSIELQRMALYPSLGLRTVPTWLSRLAHGCVDHVSIAWRPPPLMVWVGVRPPPPPRSNATVKNCTVLKAWK